MTVSGAEDAHNAFEQASSRLSKGLETCRVVVETYRELLGAERVQQCDYSGTPAAANDDGDESAPEQDASVSSL